MGLGTMGIPDWLPPYGATAAAALFGSVARGKTWRGEDGKIQMGRVFPEIATALGLSIGVMALGEYGHVDLKILAGLAVFAGWLGPAAVSDMVLARIGAKKP